MATVRQPISRLPIVETIGLEGLLPALENPFETNKRTVAISVDNLLADAVRGLLVRIGLWLSGALVDNELLFRHIFPEAVLFPEDLENSFGRTIVPAASDAEFDIRKNDVSFATITFPAGLEDAVFSGAETVFAAGDIISVHAPSPVDASLLGVAITLSGSRSS